MYRRTTALIAGLLAATAGLTACGSDAPAPADVGALDESPAVVSALDDLYQQAQEAGQDEVTVYTASVDGPEPWAPFTARYPGITVKPVQLIGAEFVAKMDQEVSSGNPVGDVILQGASSAVRYAQEGALESYTPVGSDGIAAIGHEPSLDASCVAPYGEAVTIIYNTDKISEGDAPTSWDDLLDPSLKGRIVLQGVDKPSTTTRTAALLEANGVIDDSYLQSLADQDPVRVAEPAQLSAALISGQADVGLARSAFVYPDIQKGAPLAQVFPVGGGSVMSANYGCVVKGAPHQAAAELLLAWMLTTEAQQHFASLGFYPFRAGVEPEGGLPPIESIDDFVTVPAAQEPQLLAAMTQKMSALFG